MGEESGIVNVELLSLDNSPHWLTVFELLEETGFPLA